MPFVAPPLIETSRTRLRPILESDLPALLELNSDEEVTRFLGHPPWKAMAQAEDWFKRISTQQTLGSALEFVLLERQTGAMIGRCGLFEHEPIDGHASVGYILARAYWQQGYMREALTALISSAFRDMGLRKLEARVEAENAASAGLLRRLGFTKEGVLRERWISHDTTIDAEIYGLLAREWPGNP